MTDQIRWTVVLPHDRWLMVGEHGCSPRNATVEDVTLAGYVPAADLAAAESRATAAERERDEARAKLGAGVDKVYYESVVEIRHLLTESGIDADDKATPDRVALLIADRDSLRAKLADVQAENTRFHEAFLVQRDCVVRDLRARLDRYAALESAVRDWRMEQASIPEGAAAKRLYALTPAAPAAKPPCLDCTHAVGRCCDLPVDLCADCNGPDYRHFTRRLPVVAQTCGECEHLAPRLAAGRSRECLIPHISATDSARESSPACPAFVRRLPVVEEQKLCKTCAHDKGSLCQAEPGGIDCWRDGGYVSWSPRPAAQEVE